MYGTTNIKEEIQYRKKESKFRRKERRRKKG
jgi:hypothetical protein